MWQMDVVKSTMANKKKNRNSMRLFFSSAMSFLWNNKQNKWNDSKRHRIMSISIIKAHFQVKLNNNEKWQSTLKCQICYECLNVYLFRCKFFFSLLFSVRWLLRVMVCSCDVAHSHATMRLNYNDFVLNLNAIHWPPSKYTNHILTAHNNHRFEFKKIM